MSMYKDYLKEEEGHETIETDYGFCSYTLNRRSGEFFCAHLYVKPECRRRGKGVDFGVELERTARELGARYMTGNVWLNSANRDRFVEKLRIFEAFGFEVDCVQQGVVILVKNLEA